MGMWGIKPSFLDSDSIIDNRDVILVLKSYSEISG